MNGGHAIGRALARPMALPTLRLNMNTVVMDSGLAPSGAHSRDPLARPGMTVSGLNCPAHPVTMAFRETRHEHP
jgi:hypothetical protein